MEIIVILSIGLLGINLMHLIFDDFPINGIYIGVTSLFAVIIIILASSIKSKPEAIDVYRNETTLEITYRDGIPIDSVVVWK